MTNEIVTQEQARELDLSRPQDMARVFVASGYWRDMGSASQAIVKIMAGRELGMPAFASLQGIDVIQGRLRLTANTLAAMVKEHDGTDYRVRKWTDEECAIAFYENGEPEAVGVSTFTMKDAVRAGLANKDNWKKWPRQMLFARAMSQGVSAFVPHVTKGIRAYTEGDDLGPARVEAPPSRVDALNAALEDNPPPPAGEDTGDEGDAGTPDDSPEVIPPGDAPTTDDTSQLLGCAASDDAGASPDVMSDEAREWFGEEG